MQRIANALRSDQLNLAAGLLVLLLLALLNFSSTGVVRGGDDDEGSGIGGTGRQAIPGSESGFGGTGFKPFVGMNGDLELEILRSPTASERAITGNLDLDIDSAIPVQAAPVERFIAVVPERAITRDSSAIDITEQIQRDIDSNALYFQRQQRTQQAVSSSRIALESHGADDSAMQAIAAAVEAAPALVASEVAAANEQSLTWGAVAEYLNREQSAAPGLNSTQLAAADTVDDEELARLARPERIQRPELPPVQRVRPIQRAAILPPRIRPLSL